MFQESWILNLQAQHNHDAHNMVTNLQIGHHPGICDWTGTSYKSEMGWKPEERAESHCLQEASMHFQELHVHIVPEGLQGERIGRGTHHSCQTAR